MIEQSLARTSTDLTDSRGRLGGVNSTVAPQRRTSEGEHPRWQIEISTMFTLGETMCGGDIARYAAIEAGILDAPGVAHNRHCASGLAAIQTAAASIMAGMDRVVIAGGTNSSSTAPRDKRRNPGTDGRRGSMPVTGA
jgi:acetyl-CoA acetyltransferase